MEALILSRIHDLLVYRRWFRVNRWATWTEERREYEIELRALLRLARQYRREFRLRDHPEDATWTNREGMPEFNGAFR